MKQISDHQIEEFLSLFDGDIAKAHAALTQYSEQHIKSDASRKSQVRADREKIISLHDVYKCYKSGKQTVDALRGISLSISKGEFIAITGPSGSGKSTLLQIIGCLDKPTSGKVIVDSKEATDLGDDALSELRQNVIGFIFQSFYLQPFLRLDDNIAVPAMFTNKKSININNKAESLLQQVGLTERARHFPKELSGGQMQRAAIARALINDPRIILADEPTGNLDSINGQSIIDLFKSIQNELGTTVIIVTHDASIARQADRVIRLRDGAIA